jgi:hypothetical protein
MNDRTPVKRMLAEVLKGGDPAAQRSEDRRAMTTKKARSIFEIDDLGTSGDLQQLLEN